MSALLVWGIILALCVAIVGCTQPVGLVATAAIMTAVTVVATQYVERELGIHWTTLAAVASFTLLAAGHYRQILHNKVNTAGRH